MHCLYKIEFASSYGISRIYFVNGGQIPSLRVVRTSQVVHVRCAMLQHKLTTQLLLLLLGCKAARPMTSIISRPLPSLTLLTQFLPRT